MNTCFYPRQPVDRHVFLPTLIFTSSSCFYPHPSNKKGSISIRCKRLSWRNTRVSARAALTKLFINLEALLTDGAPALRHPGSAPIATRSAFRGHPWPLVRFAHNRCRLRRQPKAAMRPAPRIQQSKNDPCPSGTCRTSMYSALPCAL